MMHSKRLLAVVLASLVVLAGCVTVQMPQYLKDKNPYRQEFYTSYDQALAATTQALDKAGWKIAKQENPFVFEDNSAAPEAQSKQIILFTNVRQTSMLLSSRYTLLNVLVRENNEKIEVEIRYYSVLSAALKSMESYRNDGLVGKIFDDIAKMINSSSL